MRKIITKTMSVLISLAIILLPARDAFSLPAGEVVINGTAMFDRSEANTLKVTTSTNNVIINYDSFSIGENEYVYFYMPSTSASALNKVMGTDVSRLIGSLSANGRIFIINTNGIVIGPQANIDVGSLIASTLSISNEDFLSGNYRFEDLSDEAARILNEGNITVAEGGFIALLSDSVENSGVITAEKGSIALASGKKMTLSFDNDGLIQVAIDESTQKKLEGVDDAILNLGTISADGGVVLLKADVVKDVFKNAINNEGIVQANAVLEKDGKIEIVATDDINLTGTLYADKSPISIKTDGSIYSHGEMYAKDGTITVCALKTVDLGGTYVADSIIIDPDEINITTAYNGGSTTFWATGDINISADVTTSGSLYVYADSNDAAGNKNNGTGRVNQTAGTLRATSGNVYIDGSGDTHLHNVTSDSGTIQIGQYVGSHTMDSVGVTGNLTASTGISVYSNGDINSYGNVTTSSGGVYLYGDYDANGAGGVMAGDITGPSGIYIYGGEDIITGALTSTGGDVLIDNNSGSYDPDNVIIGGDITHYDGVTIYANDDIHVAGDIIKNGSATSGEIYLYGDYDGNDNGRVIAGDIETYDDISIYSGEDVVTGGLTTTSGSISISSYGGSYNPDSVTVGGDITHYDGVTIYSNTDINIGGDIIKTGSATSGSVYLYGDYDTNDSGGVTVGDITVYSDIYVYGGEDIVTGAITTTSGSFSASGYMGSYYPDSVTVGGNISTYGGTTIYANDGAAVFGSITDSNHGNTTIYGDYDNDDSGGVIVSGDIMSYSGIEIYAADDVKLAGLSVTGGSGSIYVQGSSYYPDSIAITGDVTTGSSNYLYVYADGDVRIYGDISCYGGDIYANYDMSGSEYLIMGGDITLNGGSLYLRGHDYMVLNDINGSGYIYIDSSYYPDYLALAGTTLSGSVYLYLYASNDIYYDTNIHPSLPGNVSIMSGSSVGEAWTTYNESSTLYIDQSGDLRIRSITVTGGNSLYIGMSTQPDSVRIFGDVSANDVYIYAKNDIGVYGDVTSTSSSGYTNLYSNYDNSGTGSVTVTGTVTGPGSAYIYGADDITVGGLSSASGSFDISSYWGSYHPDNVNIDGDMSVYSGGTIISDGDISVAGDFSSTGNNSSVYFYGDYSGGDTGDLIITGTTSTNGYTYLYTEGDFKTGAITVNSYSLSIDNYTGSYDPLSVVIGGNISTDGATIYSKDKINVAGDVTSSNNSVSFYADNDADDAGGVIVTGAITAPGGACIYSTDKMRLSDVTASSGSISMSTAQGMCPDSIVVAGDVTASSGVSADADGNVTIAGDVTNSSSGTYIGSDYDQDGTGSLVVSKTIEGGSSLVETYASDEVWLGSVTTSSTLTITGTSYYPDDIYINGDVSASNGVIAYANGNIHVNADVTSSSANILLQADKDNGGTGSYNQSAGTVSVGSSSYNITIYSAGSTSTLGNITAPGYLYLYPSSGNSVTYAAGHAAMSVKDLSIQSSTTVNANNSVWTISDNWSAPSGTFNSDTSTVIFSAGTSGKTITPSNSFHNVLFNNSSDSWTLSSYSLSANDITVAAGTFSTSGYGATLADDLRIGDDYGQGSGMFDASSCTALDVAGDVVVTSGTLQAPSTLGDSYFTVGGNWEISGSGIFTNNSARVVFDGTSNPNLTITASSGTSDFYDVKFNGSGSTWTLQDSLTATNNMNVTSGTVDTGSGNTIAVSTILTVDGGGISAGSQGIDIDANSINHTSGSFSTSGDIYLDGSSLFTLGNIDSANNLTIGSSTAPSSISQAGGTTISVTTLTAESANAISLTETANDVNTLNLTSGNDQNISFTDTDDVDIQLANAGAGDVSITAGGNITDSGAITAAKLTVNTSGAGSLGAINLNTASTDVNTVNLTSGNNQNISFTDTDAVDIELANAGAGDVSITAGGNITDSGAITAAKLTVDTSGAGALGAINLNTASTDVNKINLTSGNNQAISFTDTDTVDVELANAGSGDVTLTSGGAITQSGAGADVLATVLTADAQNGIDLDTTVTSLDLSTAATGDITIDETNAITITDISCADGDIQVTNATGDMNLLVTTAETNTVTLEATTGAITDGNAASTNVTSSTLVITAQNDIGSSSNPINTSGITDNLTYNSQAGNVYIDIATETADTVTITNIDQTASYNLTCAKTVDITSLTSDGNVNITTSAGNINITDVTGGGYVNLSTPNGSILATGSTISGSSGRVEAGGVVGTSSKAINLAIDGPMTVIANGTSGLYSAYLTGRANLMTNDAPGIISMNGNLVHLPKGIGEAVSNTESTINEYEEMKDLETRPDGGKYIVSEVPAPEAPNLASEYIDTTDFVLENPYEFNAGPYLIATPNVR